MRSESFPLVNAAHEVRPMNGGIFQPSTRIGTSLRGALTLNTPGVVAPLRPVRVSIFAESKPRSAAKRADAKSAPPVRRIVEKNRFRGDMAPARLHLLQTKSTLHRR